MIVLVLLLAAQSTASTAACSREAIEQSHLAAIETLKARINKLVDERRSLMSRRSEIAKRSVKLAEMSTIKREFSEAFGKSQEDLEHLDLAYTARINTITEEADGIKLDKDAEQIRYESNLSRCRMK